MAVEAQRAAQARAEHEAEVEAEAEAERQAEEDARQQARAEEEARRAALRAEFDRLSARYDELTGRPGRADELLRMNLCGPKGMPGLSAQVEHLRPAVDAEEYYLAHKDDPPWTGDVSKLVPDSRMTSPRIAGKTQDGFVTPGGKVRQTYGRHGIELGEVFGYFRWTPENGLEVAEPDDEAQS